MYDLDLIFQYNIVSFKKTAKNFEIILIIIILYKSVSISLIFHTL